MISATPLGKPTLDFCAFSIPIGSKPKCTNLVIDFVGVVKITFELPDHLLADFVATGKTHFA